MARYESVRLSCEFYDSLRSETLVYPEQEFKAGERKEGEVTLQMPSSPPQGRGVVHWYVALVAEIPNWPDYETVEKVNIDKT